jgi:hypothetical protein
VLEEIACDLEYYGHPTARALPVSLMIEYYEKLKKRPPRC